MNKKSAITAKDRDIWTKYFHNKALEKFDENCIEELTNRKNLDNEIKIEE